MMAAEHWNNTSDLIAALRSYTQGDDDGVIVKVSRQACDEAADRIAALVLAELKAERDAFARAIDTLNGKVLAVEQERDAAVADAERYRWLAKKAFTDERDGGYVRFYVFPHITYADGSTFEGRKPTYYTTLDAAIDAAIAAKGE
jgi:hypothetical protein